MYPGGQQYPGEDPQQWQQQPPYPPQQPQQPPYPQQQPYPPQQQPFPQVPPYGQQQPFPPPGFPPPAGYPVPPQKSSQRGVIAVVAGVAVVAMLSVLGVAVYFIGTSRHKDTGTTTAGVSQSPGAPSQPSDQSSGPPPADGLAAGSGPVKVDVYVDYQCPPCSSFEAATADTLTGDVTSGKITLRIHPVAFIDDRSKNKYSTRAAAAAACAFDGGKILDFHKYLLAHQPAEDTAGPTDDDLVTAGRSLGLGSAFAACVTDKRRLTWVAQATTAAGPAGVTSVPTAFVNGASVDSTNAALVTAIAGAN